MRAPTDPQPHPRLPPLLSEFAREERDGEDGPSAPPAARSVSDPFPLPSSFPINTDRPPMGTHRGSVDSLTSVTSLPYLGTVRGVPMGNRAPLRVTNPGDRMSMSSSSDSLAQMPKPKPVKGSPLRDGVAFDVPEEQVPAPSTHILQLPGRTSSDSSSGSSRKGKSRKDGKEKETMRVDEGDQEKILIVLLDEKDGGASKNKGGRFDDDTTWHGLERRFSAPSSRKPSPPRPTHDSPWLGPLVSQNEDVTFIHTPTDHLYSDDDSDDNEDDSADWGLVPVKSLLSQMGYLAPEAAVLGRASPSPYGSYAALPGPYTTPYSSPYAMAAARQLAASYSSPYVSPAQGAGSPYNQLQLRPPSRPQTPTSYYAGGTPQQQPWMSPGGGGPVYPPANYSSPAPGPYVTPTPVYVGPYASPSPGGYTPEAAAHASPYASPAGIYDLAAGYSSPYVPPLQGARSSSGFYYN
ncbi:hypothetical protein C8F04DRAFT_1129591 [Mycena alexandri]|uniref:Uncharacterized protein n=1 Tax=Mycena alexandri TaxID=1745969 RepID=A0AAD6SC16_9AGAR|nr:hypothetical protein C8F04DRAFT_1129591 [Mycena alexandri]